jgi:hypothetical protein
LKFFLLPAACLILLFSSCKKQSNNAPKNTITANIDGTDVSFNTNTYVHIDANEPGQYPYYLTIDGETDNSTSRASITIGVVSKNSITSGTFLSSDTDPAAVSFSQLIYDRAVPGSQLAHPYITNNNLQNSTTVSISTLSATRVQGAFSGVLIYSLGGLPGKTITNGKFDLAIN